MKPRPRGVGKGIAQIDTEVERCENFFPVKDQADSWKLDGRIQGLLYARRMITDQWPDPD